MVTHEFLDSSVIRRDMEELSQCGLNWNRISDTGILITGAYGMLASYIVYFLIFLNEFCDSNIKIYAQFRDKTKLRKRFGKYVEKPYFNSMQCDLSEELSLPGDVDYIVHAAGLASSNHYAKCPVDVLLPNVVGTYNLLNLACLKKVRGFLFFSTGGVYGKTKDNSKINECDFGSLDPASPHSCYEESKRMGETMCYSYAKQFSVPAKVVRIAHTYGPTMDLETDPRVFSEFMRNAIEGNDIVMKSDGTAKRVFCYLTDAVAGFFTILLDGTVGEAYNITNPGEQLTISELAELVLELSGNRKRVVFKQRDKSESYLEDPNAGFSVLSVAKLETLGWKPGVSARDGFRRVMSHFTNI